MKRLFNDYVAKLIEELEACGIVYEAPDYDPSGANQFTVLDSVHHWGFITRHYCELDWDILTFYDWEYQEIVSLNANEYTEYRLDNGFLDVVEHETFHDFKEEFRVNLHKGAPVRVEDVVAIGYKTVEGCLDQRFYILKGRLSWLWKDGEGLRPLESGITVEDFVADEYTLIDPDHYVSNLSHLNNVLHRSKSC